MTKSRKRSGANNSALLAKSVTKDMDSEYVTTLAGDGDDKVELWIPSTNMGINYAIGDPRYGAFPIGRITEIFGKKSSAKSLILYDAGQNVQKMGGIFILIDTESSFSRNFGKYLGIDFDRFIYAHLRTIEEVTDFIIEVLERIREEDEDVPVLVGWDSLAASTTIREEDTEEEKGKSEMGYRGQLMSRQMRKIGGIIYREKTAYVVINQTRHKIGVMFGSPITTPGGDALPFHASIRMQVTRTKKIKRKKRMIGHKVKIFCEKNKIRPPFSETEINIYVDRVGQRYGLDQWSGLSELLVKDEILTMSKQKATFVSDPSTSFNVRNIDEWWEAILEDIPEDLYEGTSDGDEEEEEEEEEDDE